MAGRNVLILMSDEHLRDHHDGGLITGVFMIRHGRWTYAAYRGYAPELCGRDEIPAREDFDQSPVAA